MVNQFQSEVSNNRGSGPFDRQVANSLLYFLQFYIHVSEVVGKELSRLHHVNQ